LDAAELRSRVSALMAAVASGSENAFADLYDAVAPVVYGVAQRVIRQAEQAEEVTQEVLLEVWQHSTRYDPARGSALSWVLTIAHHRAVDRVRSAQSRRTREQLIGQRELDRDHDQVIETVEHRAETDALKDCIDELTELQRESVTMAYFGGYSYPEVADRLRTPLGTVKTRMRDGLIRLRDCMGVMS
jgi:RNA polymerase sigma-70 factor (ECF subfamily)